MNIRSLLLAGTVFPFALSYPALALDRGASAGELWQTAQNDQPCPEGQECPPAGITPLPQGEDTIIEGTDPNPDLNAPPPDQLPEVLPEEPAQPLPEEQIQPLPEEQPQPLPEEPVQPLPEEPVQPPPEDQIQPPPAEPIQPLPEEQIQPLPEEQIQPLPEEQIQPLPEEQPQPQPEPLPQEDVTPLPQGEDTIIEQQLPQEPDTPLPQGEETQPPPAPEGDLTPLPQGEDTTIEQLERQGDNEEAGRVRNLRSRLLRQLEEVLVPQDEPQNQERRGRRRGYENRYDEEDVLERRGGDVIIDLGGGHIYVEPEQPDDADRLLYDADNVDVEQLRGGRSRTTVYRRNGVQIVTTRDRYGDIISRVKRLPDGREVVLIDNRFPEDYDPRRQVILRDVPPARVRIPEDEYIVDLGGASYDDIRGALLAPPVQRLERPYTLDEVLRNEEVRAYSPRIDLDTITFDLGSATIGSDQMRSLAYLGQAMADVLAEHPDEVYLIEGHTDRVGGNYDNLILSNRRAEAVAVALSQNFDIPPENLVTEGYGEEYPKIDTDEAERRNRRATVRRVTDLLQAQNQ